MLKTNKAKKDILLQSIENKLESSTITVSLSQDALLTSKFLNSNLGNVQSARNISTKLPSINFSKQEYPTIFASQYGTQDSQLSHVLERYRMIQKGDITKQHQDFKRNVKIQKEKQIEEIKANILKQSSLLNSQSKVPKNRDFRGRMSKGKEFIEDFLLPNNTVNSKPTSEKNILLIPNMPSLNLAQKRSKRKTSIDIVVEAIQEVRKPTEDTALKNFETKSSAPFSYSKPNKLGQLKSYVTSNLMVFQDGSFNAKKDDYKSSLSKVKRDLERRKKKIYNPDAELSLSQISKISKAQVSHCEQRIEEKRRKKEEKIVNLEYDKEDLPLLQQLEMSYEINESSESSKESNSQKFNSNSNWKVSKDVIKRHIDELLRQYDSNHQSILDEVLNETLVEDPSLNMLKQNLNL